MTDEKTVPMKKYEVDFSVTLPGNTRPSQIHIPVEAYSIDGAIRAAEDVWNRAAKPRNATVKELEGIING